MLSCKLFAHEESWSKMIILIILNNYNKYIFVYKYSSGLNIMILKKEYILISDYLTKYYILYRSRCFSVVFKVANTAFHQSSPWCAEELSEVWSFWNAVGLIYSTTLPVIVPQKQEKRDECSSCPLHLPEWAKGKCLKH